MENFIRAKLRVLTQEQPLKNLWELFCPSEVKAQRYRFFWDRGLYVKWCRVGMIQICKYKVVGHRRPLKDQGGMLLLKSIVDSQCSWWTAEWCIYFRALGCLSYSNRPPMPAPPRPTSPFCVLLLHLQSLVHPLASQHRSQTTNQS